MGNNDLFAGQPDGSANKDFNSLSGKHKLPTPGRVGQTGCYTRWSLGQPMRALTKDRT